MRSPKTNRCNCGFRSSTPLKRGDFMPYRTWSFTSRICESLRQARQATRLPKRRVGSCAQATDCHDAQDEGQVRAKVGRAIRHRASLRRGSIPARRFPGSPTYATNQRKVPQKIFFLKFDLFCCLSDFHWGNFFCGLSDPWCTLLCISWIYLVFPNFYGPSPTKKWLPPIALRC